MTAAVKSPYLTTDQAIEADLGSLDFLWIEVTNKCNLECVHCYADSSPHSPLTEGVSPSQYITLLDEAFSLGCRGVQFIGGEPLLYPHIMSLVSHAHAIGYELIEVYTNGTLLKEQVCSELAKYNVQVAVSVYADRGTIHDTITMRTGSFERTIKGIQCALSYNIPVRVGIIVMHENEQIAARTKQYLISLGVQKVGIDRMRGIGRGASQIQHSDPLKELCGACWQGKLAITPNGDVYPCVFSRFHKVGHVEEGLGAILDREVLRDFRYTVRSYKRTRAASCNPDADDSCSPDNNTDCTPDVSCNPPAQCSPDNCSPDMGCEPKNK